MKKEALFVLCLALAASASAETPILSSLREMAPEIESKDVQSAPIDAVVVDQDEETGPETLDDIGAAKWFRKQFHWAGKPKFGKLNGYWGESARTLPGGNWQGFGTEGRKLDPSLNFAVGPEKKVGRIRATLMAFAQDEAAVADIVPTLRSVVFKMNFTLNGSTTETGFEHFTCRSIDENNLICRVETIPGKWVDITPPVGHYQNFVETAHPGKAGREKSYRLYQRLK